MRRIALLIAALAVTVPACVAPFPTESPITTYRDFRQALETNELDETLPVITIVIHASGDDAVDVYTEGDEASRIGLAEGAAEWLDAYFPLAEPNPFFEDVATVQLGERLVRRDGDRWIMSFDSVGLLYVAHRAGYQGATLIVCPPNVAHRVASSRRPELDPLDVECYGGRGWEVTDAKPLRVTLELTPSTRDYLIFVAATILGVILLSALAWLTGNTLRRGPFRRRNAAAVALGLVAGSAAMGGVSITVGTAATGLGPSDNLALAENLDAAMYALSAAIPSIVAAIPGLIFLVLLVKKRPWPDEPLAELRSWPAPPPPTRPPTAPPPPPISWGSR